ncbi:MAG TPA: hypothetical protein VK929_04535 [Longimicrobiales bacterium]|nr:hypothetical protein [Longimicrobiales bacterium]
MQKETGVFRKLVGVALLFMLFVGYTPTAVQAQTETEKIAECVDEAIAAAVECIDDLAWYWEWLCVAKFAADSILCLPKLVLDGAQVE